jgi:hypothetical protein
VFPSVHLPLAAHTDVPRVATPGAAGGYLAYVPATLGLVDESDVEIRPSP